MRTVNFSFYKIIVDVELEEIFNPTIIDYLYRFRHHLNLYSDSLVDAIEPQHKVSKFW